MTLFDSIDYTSCSTFDCPVYDRWQVTAFSYKTFIAVILLNVFYTFQDSLDESTVHSCDWVTNTNSKLPSKQ
jgi:hypothetical protein